MKSKFLISTNFVTEKMEYITKGKYSEIVLLESWEKKKKTTTKKALSSFQMLLLYNNGYNSLVKIGIIHFGLKIFHFKLISKILFSWCTRRYTVFILYKYIGIINIALSYNMRKQLTDK